MNDEGAVSPPSVHGGYFSQADADLLRQLVQAAGLPTDRAVALDRRSRRVGKPGAAAALIGNARTLVTMVGALAGADEAKAVLRHARETGNKIVVVGARPELVAPVLVRWPHIPTDALGYDAVVCIACDDPVTGAQRAALESLGTIPLGVLVSDLSQPINNSERKAAHALQSVVETVRVVFLGAPGHELERGEAAELLDYARQQMGVAGFLGARFDKAALFFDKPETRSALPAVLGGANNVLEGAVALAGRNAAAALGTSLAALLDDIEGGLAGREPPPQRHLSEEDCSRLVRQFEGHVTQLGQEISKLVQSGEITSTEAARRHVQNVVAGWVSGRGLAGETVKLAEAVRPGLKACLSAEVARVSDDLTVEPPPRRVRRRAETARRDRVITLALAALSGQPVLRAAVAVASGALVFVATSALVAIVFAGSQIAGLVPIALGMLVGAGLYIAMSNPAIVGYSTQRDVRDEPLRPEATPLKGWALFDSSLVAAVSDHLDPTDVTAGSHAAIDDLRQRYLGGDRDD